MTGPRKKKPKTFIAQERNGEVVVWEEILATKTLEEAMKLVLLKFNITVKPQKT